MKYEKPEVVVLDQAILAVQSTSSRDLASTCILPPRLTRRRTPNPQCRERDLQHTRRKGKHS